MRGEIKFLPGTFLPCCPRPERRFYLQILTMKVFWQSPERTSLIPLNAQRTVAEPLTAAVTSIEPSLRRCHAVWNDLSIKRWGYKDREIWKNDRCRLVLVRSNDGIDWHSHEIIEYDIECGYCYTAMHFLNDGGFLLAYCCGGYGGSCLRDTGIRKFY